MGHNLSWRTFTLCDLDGYLASLSPGFLFHKMGVFDEQKLYRVTGVELCSVCRFRGEEPRENGACALCCFGRCLSTCLSSDPSWSP